jgi:protease I
MFGDIDIYRLGDRSVVRKMGKLSGKKIAVVLENDFEDSEFYVPYNRLREEGAELTVVGLERGKALKGKSEGYKATVDMSFGEVAAEDFDAILIPGGYSPDKLRTHDEALNFVKAFREKPVFAICHGPQLRISAEMVKDRTMTSWPSVAVDLKNAGAHWVDKAVVVDGNIITSRKPADLEVFVDASIKKLVGK